MQVALEVLDASVPARPIELLAGVIMTTTTIFGFRAINLPSTLLVPVLIAVTAPLIAGSLGETSLADIMTSPTISELSFGDDVSAMVGAVVVGAVILPGITRFIRH